MSKELAPGQIVQNVEDVRVPDHAAVLDANLLVVLINVAHFHNTLVERLLSTEKTTRFQHILPLTEQRILLTGTQRRRSAWPFACPIGYRLSAWDRPLDGSCPSSR